jgi:hypothetical protein
MLNADRTPQSTTGDPHVITEHFHVISNDEKHHHHFTHYVQNQIAEYLRSISCDVYVMHEFCNGCASQYKSRHCLGDLSNSFREFGYRKILFSQQRNSVIFVMNISSNQSMTAVSGGFLDILNLFREPNHGFINQFQRFGLSTKLSQFKRAIYQ